MAKITIPAAQLSHLAMTVGSDAPYYQEFNKTLMAQSSIGKAIEEANLRRQQALELEDQRNSRSPDALLSNTMTGFGIPQNAKEDVRTYLQTGSLPDKYTPLPADVSGPSIPKPDWAGNLGKVARQLMTMQNALTLGDKSVENTAKAYGTYDNLDKQDRVINGSLPASLLGQAVAASAGRKLVDNIGDTGMGYDMFTGQGTTLDSGLRKVFGDKATAVIGKDNAQASHSRASTDKVRQDIEMGSKGVLTDTDNGKMLVDPRTGLAIPIKDSQGNTISKSKDLNNDQANALTFATRMQASHDILADMEKKGVKTPGVVKMAANGMPDWAGGGIAQAGANLVQSPEQQQVEQAQRDFINAVLRRESGAAISMGEFTNAAKQYFPQPGDSKQVIQQKLDARQRVINGMLEAVPQARRPKPGAAASPAPAASPRVVSVDY